MLLLPLPRQTSPPPPPRHVNACLCSTGGQPQQGGKDVHDVRRVRDHPASRGGREDGRVGAEQHGRAASAAVPQRAFLTAKREVTGATGAARTVAGNAATVVAEEQKQRVVVQAYQGGDGSSALVAAKRAARANRAFDKQPCIAQPKLTNIAMTTSEPKSGYDCTPDGGADDGDGPHTGCLQLLDSAANHLIHSPAGPSPSIGWMWSDGRHCAQQMVQCGSITCGSVSTWVCSTTVGTRA